MKRLLIAPLLLLSAVACTKKAEQPVTPEAQSEQTPATDATEATPAAGAAGEDEPYVPTHEVERWSVAPELVDCVGVAPQKCLRIRRADNATWENLFSGIEGFEHEEGTRYELSVELIPVENPPADGSSIRYKLVEILAPRPDLEPKTCTSNEDCEDGTFCTGPAGCVVPWTCEPMRPCTMDLRPYCSCEGETIEGSGTCPPAPYLHAGPCR